METFYATLSGICFTLLGLWWVAVQMKYELWMSTSARRLTAYAASMHFIFVWQFFSEAAPNS